MIAEAPAPTSTPSTLPTTVARSVEFPAAERAAVDASARAPVLFFFGNAILWLFLATFLGLISSIQLYRPEFLADYAFLSYGRIWPAYTNVINFGWASLSGMGVAIWLL